MSPTEKAVSFGQHFSFPPSRYPQNDRRFFSPDIRRWRARLTCNYSSSSSSSGSLLGPLLFPQPPRCVCVLFLLLFSSLSSFNAALSLSVSSPFVRPRVLAEATSAGPQERKRERLSPASDRACDDLASLFLPPERTNEEKRALQVYVLQTGGSAGGLLFSWNGASVLTVQGQLNNDADD